MLSAMIILLLQGGYFMLRLTGNNGSFPKPLGTDEEKKYLEMYAKGDIAARNVLIERNLRLVAHIINNS